MSDWMKYMVVVVLLGINSLVFAQSDTNDSLVISECVDFPDKEAEFPGGYQAFQEFVAKNYNYPTVELIDDTKTTIYVRFDVDEHGTISNITIEKGVNNAFDDEAIRLVEKMPNWIPAEKLNKKVKSSVLIPIRICLN